MRILQIGKYYHPAHGGIETMLRNLSEGLQRAGDEVTVLCSGHGGSAGATAPRRSEEMINGVRVIRAPFLGSLFSQPISPSLPFEILSLARRADLIHIHCPNPLAESSVLALPGSIPLAVSYHSDVVRQKAVLPLYGPLLRRFLKRASRIVVATPNHISHSPFLNRLARKCAVIPYGIDASPFEPGAASEARAAEIRREHGRFILFVGRLVSYKGVHVLLEAMREVDAALVLIGSGPLQAELLKKAEDLGIRDRVKFLGSVPSTPELVAHYRACEMLVLPSISKAEAFGLVLVEAMACGKPSIATRLDSGVTLVNEEGVTGLLVDPSDAAGLGAAINRLLTDGTLRERMGTAARRRFDSRFTSERMVDAYRGLYAELASE